MSSEKLKRRPFLYPAEGKMLSTTLRLSTKQREKLAVLGGGKWVRVMIDAARTDKLD